ncbi:MAG: PQQ-dependent sugar dehydrogenase [Chitinophagaceae bacterium]|nr:PQQ-dependent sugar dehydrogenase [Chitinophagaceae bacterium]
MLKKFGWLSWLVAVPLVAALHCTKNGNNNQEPDNAVAIRDSVVLTGLSHPWEIKFDNDNFIWITERNGRVSRFNPRNGEHNVVLKIDEVVSQGEGGLLGLALHPDWEVTPWVYLVYNYESDGDYLEKLVRYRWHAETNSLSNPETLLHNIPASNIHNGSRLFNSRSRFVYDHGRCFETIACTGSQFPGGENSQVKTRWKHTGRQPSSG